MRGFALQLPFFCFNEAQHCVRSALSVCRSPEQITSLSWVFMMWAACVRSGWFMRHILKKPTNLMWRLMEFLISVNKVLLYQGWVVVARFVLYFCFTSYERVELLQMSPPEHHLLLVPQRLLWTVKICTPSSERSERSAVRYLASFIHVIFVSFFISGFLDFGFCY
jgi:hypothetical protein